MTRKELVVSALENGTVLDHIPAENVYKALDLLDLKGIGNQITIGINLNSKAQGRKGIIKVEDKFFEDEELNKLALIAPQATVNIIRDGKIVKREQLTLPKKITGVIKCANPRCITSTEQEIVHEFYLANADKKTYRCKYCDTDAPVRNDMKLK